MSDERIRELEAMVAALSAELEETNRGVVALHVENATILDVEHQIALTLQRRLLPDELPKIEGVESAVRYEAGTEQLSVGGDFYELFELEPGRVAFAIGDVQGHSLEAATVMGELRSALRAYLLVDHGPAATLDRLNDLLNRFHPELTATVALGVLDGSTLTLANAGHLPLVLRTDEGAELLHPRGSLLGLPSTREELVRQLPAGALLLLVTDGLVERRGVDLDHGIEQLRLVVELGGDDLEVLCDKVLLEVGPGDLAEDDVAVLAVRVSP